MAEATQDLFTQVNEAKDWNDLADLEKKHLPIITAPDEVKAGECFEVTVEVGKLLDHPNEKKHFIEFIELYANHIYLARMDFTAETTCPVMKVCVALPEGMTELRAFERCNMHGVWETTKPITVQ